jgi:hypothetical protein
MTKQYPTTHLENFLECRCPCDVCKERSDLLNTLGKASTKFIMPYLLARGDNINTLFQNLETALNHNDLDDLTNLEIIRSQTDELDALPTNEKFILIMLAHFGILTLVHLQSNIAFDIENDTPQPHTRN